MDNRPATETMFEQFLRENIPGAVGTTIDPSPASRSILDVAKLLDTWAVPGDFVRHQAASAIRTMYAELERLKSPTKNSALEAKWRPVAGVKRQYGVNMVECTIAVGKDEIVSVVCDVSCKDAAVDAVLKAFSK